MTDHKNPVKLLLNLSITAWNVHCKDRFSLKNRGFKIISNSPRLPLVIMVCPSFALSLFFLLLILWSPNGTSLCGKTKEWIDFLGTLRDSKNQLLLYLRCLEGKLHQWINPGAHFPDKWPYVVEIRTVNFTNAEGAAAKEHVPLFCYSLLVLSGQDEWWRIWTFYWANDWYKFQRLPYCPLHN